MVSRTWILGATVAVLLIGLANSRAAAQGGQGHWGDWQKHPSGNHFSRNFYFKPTPQSQNFRHQQVFWTPGSKHFHYHNPYQNKVWGRCSVDPKQQDTYELLPPDKRIAINDPANVSRILAGEKAQQAFEGVKGGAWPQSLGLGEGEPRAAVPAVPPPDDAPLGTSFPKG
jgi:hypothetical protein